ncbi:MAG: hypothetical protein MR491_04265 [Mollicutes bacterium]|nr:hypothetical protein [Mollicutes bacterium]
MKNLDELRNELEKNFVGNDINVILNGDIGYFLKIKNIKFLLNRINLIISDNGENELCICLDEIGDIVVNDKVIDLEFNYEEKIKLYV